MIRAPRRGRRAIALVLLVLLIILWPAPRLETGHLRIHPYADPRYVDADYAGIRLDGVTLGGWVAGRVDGSDSRPTSGPLKLYPVVALRSDRGLRAVWFRSHGVPLPVIHSQEIATALR